MKVTVEANRPLDSSGLVLTYSVRDYWGAEQMAPATVALAQAPAPVNGHIAYSASIDLGSAPLDVGRYYEVVAEVPQGHGETYHDHTTLAILPEAPANSFKPLDIPFTSRDWDDRIPEYITLSHRLGIRVACLWSGCSWQHPDQVSAAQRRPVRQTRHGRDHGAAG